MTVLALASLPDRAGGLACTGHWTWRVANPYSAANDQSKKGSALLAFPDAPPQRHMASRVGDKATNALISRR
jgi:hypothetical protein